MLQNERASAAAYRRSPIAQSSPLIITGPAAIEKAYFRDLSSLCREAAETDDPNIFAATLQLLEAAPRELRRLRRDRAQLGQPIASWGRK